MALSIQTAKLGGRVLAKALQKLLTEMKKSKTPTIHHGKQTVKQLVGQGAGVSNIEINDSNIKSFERVARKYGIDFALKKDGAHSTPKWLVFFKARDADALTAAFSEFTAKSLRRTAEKPSVLAALNKMKELVKNQVLGKVRNKEMGREI